MASGRLYTNIEVFREGALLTEENSVRITRDAGIKEVFTTARGFAGISKGAAMMKVQIRNAVPAAGVEYDPGRDMATASLVEFTFFRAGKQMTGKFYVMQDETEHSVSAESQLSFDLVGPMQQWESLLSGLSAI